jgi:hypothetical protein
MKKIINIGLIAVLAMMSACTDLDVQPRNDLTPDVFFSDDAAYERFLTRIYAGLAVTGQQGPAGNADIKSLDEGFSSYLRQCWQLQELPTDEAIIAWNDDGLPDLVTQGWSSTNQFVRAMYYRVFFQVSLANEFLRESTPEKLDARGVSKEVVDQMATYRAEARFMRALSYWHGIDFFGDIPFYTEDQVIGSTAPTQLSRREVFNIIVNELNEIESDMLEAGTAPYGRADKGALWMLQAKLYLNGEVYTGGETYWNEAVEACNKIIESGAYTLMDEYHHNFLADNDRSTEIIWSVNFDGDATQTFGGTTYLVHAAIGGAMNAEDYGVNNGWGGLRTLPSLVDRFPDETGNIDERAIFFTEGQTKAVEAINEFTNGYTVPKYQNVTSEGVAGSDPTFADTDYPMFRFGEVHLTYAEAVLRGASNGDLGTAVAYINALRQRAYNNDAGNISEADLNLDFILDERSRELYWEGVRRTDLIRFGQFTENGTWAWKGNVQEGRTTSPHLNLYPIPAEELLANDNLEQNQGY